MAVNLRELATLHRPAISGGRGVQAQPAITRTVWCRIEPDRFDGSLRVIVRWQDLTNVNAVIGDVTRQGGDWEIYFVDSKNSFDIEGIRPYPANPRQFAELRVDNLKVKLPFT